MRLKRVVSSVLILGICAAGVADDFDFKVANIEPLRDKAVQKDIKLSEAQRAKLNSFSDVYSKAIKAKIDAYDKAKKPPDQAFGDFQFTKYAELRSNCLKTLSAAQLKRLAQITMQLAGPRAIMDRNVAIKIGLTDAQFKQILGIIQETDKKVGAIKREIGKPIEAKYKDKKPKDKKELEKLQKEVQAAIDAGMKKRAPEINKIVMESDKKINALMSKKVLENLRTVLGAPFKPSK